MKKEGGFHLIAIKPEQSNYVNQSQQAQAIKINQSWCKTIVRNRCLARENAPESIKIAFSFDWMEIFKLIIKSKPH